VRSIPRHLVAVGVVMAAAAFGAAGLAAARTFDLSASGSYVFTPNAQTTVTIGGPCSEVCSGAGYGTSRPIASSVHRVGAGRAGGQSTNAPAASSHQAFQWDDAGIGAAGMLVLLSAMLVAMSTVRRRHHRRAAVG
jgi:hypothetical protein